MAKVMFLLVSVILSIVGRSASVHAGIPPTTPPGQTPPWKQTRPGADTPPPGSRHRPGSRHPPGKQTAAYGQWAAGTHPTGMYSCFCMSALRFNPKTEVCFWVKWIPFNPPPPSKMESVLLCPSLREKRTDLTQNVLLLVPRLCITEVFPAKAQWV